MPLEYKMPTAKELRDKLRRRLLRSKQKEWSADEVIGLLQYAYLELLEEAASPKEVKDGPRTV